MEIKIKNTVVETKEITAIREYTRDRFWNRHCGFVVHLHRKEPLIFEWDIPYERTNHQIAAEKKKCEDLMKLIIAEWEKDKVIYPEEPKMKHFNL
jgi:hypothetical protein